MTDNKSSENVTGDKNLGEAITIRLHMHDKIKSRINSGNT
jgi:hypothetical protein